MATKDVFDPETGETVTVEMAGAELAAYEALRAAPEPEPGPSRDDRLLTAVAQAKAAVDAPGVFTKQQAALLAAVFEALGVAIRGA